MLAPIVAIAIAIALAFGGGAVVAKQNIGADVASTAHTIVAQVSADNSANVGTTSNQSAEWTAFAPGNGNHPDSNSNSDNDHHPITPTIPITSTIGITFTQTITDVNGLTSDDSVPGDVVQSLQAQLQAAMNAIQRGEQATAAHILDAFAHHLNALFQSGHISADNYATLRADYQSLVNQLNATPIPTVTPRAKPTHTVGKSAKADNDDEDLTATPTATPSAISPTATPTANPKKHNHNEDANDSQGDDSPSNHGPGDSNGPGNNHPGNGPIKAGVGINVQIGGHGNGHGR